MHIKEKLMIALESEAHERRLNLSLSFAGTVDWRKKSTSEDSLTDYSSLVSWSMNQQILAPEQAGLLLRLAAERPEEANATFQQAIELREAIYRVFSAIAQDEMPQSSDLDQVNAVLTQGMAQAQIFHTSEGFRWDWPDDTLTLDRMLWTVARSAAELLTSAYLDLVRECEGVGCGSLFLDISKNHSRRWCSMESCGNRAKVNRHYHRKKQTATSGGE
jgi:predicted RNA-binding Zn ribbon-like protein